MHVSEQSVIQNSNVNNFGIGDGDGSASFSTLRQLRAGHFDRLVASADRCEQVQGDQGILNIFIFN